MSAMSRGVSRRGRGWAGVLVLAALGCGGIAGCASSGERLPQCQGRSQPINPVSSHPPESTPVVTTSQPDAH
jgi:hypothetical protein